MLLVLSFPVGDRAERGFQGGVETGLLVGMEGQQYGVRRCGRRCFLREIFVGSKLELVRRIFTIDGVDCLEHGDMKNGHAASVRRRQQSLFDGDGLGLGVPIGNDIRARGLREYGEQDQCWYRAAEAASR